MHRLGEEFERCRGKERECKPERYGGTQPRATSTPRVRLGWTQLRERDRERQRDGERESALPFTLLKRLLQRAVAGRVKHVGVCVISKGTEVEEKRGRGG